jgi:hypothetical protein
VVRPKRVLQRAKVKEVGRAAQRNGLKPVTAQRSYTDAEIRALVRPERVLQRAKVKENCLPAEGSDL